MTDRGWTAASAVLAAAALYWTHELGSVLSINSYWDGRAVVEVPWIDRRWGAFGTAGAYVLAFAAAMLIAIASPRRRRCAATAVSIALVALPVAAGLRGLPEQRTYTTDSIAYVHHAALQVLEGKDPYRWPTFPAAQRRFGMDLAYHTTRTDGVPDTRYPYPALSFLLAIPFACGGDHVDLRWLSLAMLVTAALLLDRGSAPGEPPWAAISVASFPLLARLTYGSVTDAHWVLPLALAWHVLPRRPLVVGVCLGIACAIKQTPWLVAPFLAVAVVRTHGWRGGVGTTLAALGVFGATNAPWIASSPAQWLDGVLSPFLHPLSPEGHGLILFERNGLLPPLGRTGYTIATLGAYLGALLAYTTCPRLAPLGPVLGLLPAFLSWRSHANHYAMVPLLLFAGPTGPGTGSASDTGVTPQGEGHPAPPPDARST